MTPEIQSYASEVVFQLLGYRQPCVRMQTSGMAKDDGGAKVWPLDLGGDV